MVWSITTGDTGSVTGSGPIWVRWNNITHGATSDTNDYASIVLINNGAIWQTWNATSGTGSFGITSPALTNVQNVQTWTDWNSLNDLRTGHDHFAMAETAEMRAAREREREGARRRSAEARAAQAAADERAEKLLRLALNDSQRRELEARGAFTLEVHSSDGTLRRYEISRGRSGNVHLLDQTGKKVHRYCAHPNILCPNADTMLAQKLMLETNEDAFLRVANRHW